MWWWQFDKKEPLQEDLATYERFEGFREDRQRMNREKEEQKEKAKQRRGGGEKTSTTYNIPDPEV